jgi:hypothetical protein
MLFFNTQQMYMYIVSVAYLYQVMLKICVVDFEKKNFRIDSGIVF